MRLFRRKSEKVSRGDEEHQNQNIDPAVIDLTSDTDGFELVAITNQLSERDGELDHLQERLEMLREHAERLYTFDPTQTPDRRGSVDTIDLSALMTTADDGEFDRWFDVAFAEEREDEASS